MAGRRQLSSDLYDPAAVQPRLHPPCRQGERRCPMVEAGHGELDVRLSEQNEMRQMILKSLLVAAVLALSTPALADAPITLTLKNHKFTPDVIKVKANQPAMIMLINKDDTAEEFDSSVAEGREGRGGHGKGNIRLRPLAPGKYPFMGEYHAATAQGVVIAE